MGSPYAGSVIYPVSVTGVSKSIADRILAGTYPLSGALLSLATYTAGYLGSSSSSAGAYSSSSTASNSGFDGAASTQAATSLSALIFAAAMALIFA